MFQSTSFKPFDLYVDLLMVLRKTKKNRNSFRGLTLNKDTFNGILSFICYLNFNLYSRRLDFKIKREICFVAFYVMNFQPRIAKSLLLVESVRIGKNKMFIGKV